MTQKQYKGYVITNDNGQWCVNLGLERGVECFSTEEAAKAAIDVRLAEIERELGNK